MKIHLYKNQIYEWSKPKQAWVNGYKLYFFQNRPVLRTDSRTTMNKFRRKGRTFSSFFSI